MTRHIGRRYSAVALAGVLAAMGATSVVAAEVTLRMKGGDFQVSGELKASDSAYYTIVSRSLGQMTLDATRFDCVGNGCPAEPVPAVRGEAVVANLAPKAVQAGAQLSISGSNTVGNQLMPALVAAYGASMGSKATRIAKESSLDLDIQLSAPDGRDMGVVRMHRHGSSTAFSALEKGEAEIGMSSRPVKGDEVKKLQAAGLTDVSGAGSEHILGLDGLMVLVAPNNGVISLSTETIAKIFAGQIRDWSEVGRPAGKINVYAPTADSGTFDTFESLVLKPRKLELTKEAKRTENHAEQSDWIAQDPNGIGFTGIAYVRNSKGLNIETSCGLVVQPSTFTIKTEEYPLSRRLYLYTNGTPKSGLGQGLLNFAMSAQAQPIVKAVDFIDQTPDRLSYAAQAPRIANAINALPENFDERMMKVLIADLKERERVSTTFRFQTGSFVLDNKALADIARLRDWLASPTLRGKSVLLAGFADTVGSFASNRVLSEARANAVLRALGPVSGGPRLEVKGYSELAPASCNDTDEARQFNRRVEVWVGR